MTGPAEEEMPAGARAEPVTRDAKGRFLPGHAALKRGPRKMTAADFRDALHAEWEAHGAACIDRVQREQPERFLLIMMAILPRHRRGKAR